MRVHKVDFRFLTLLALGSLNCAKSEDGLTTDAGSPEPMESSTKDSSTAFSNVDSGCHDDSANCKPLLSCDEAEWCPVKTSINAAYSLMAIWGSGGHDVWTVGSGGTVAHWDGSAWTTISLKGTTTTFYSVWGSGPDDVWVASAAHNDGSGIGSTIAHFTNFDGDASTWEAMPADGTVNNQQIAVILSGWGKSSEGVYMLGATQDDTLHFNQGAKLWYKPIDSDPSYDSTWYYAGPPACQFATCGGLAGSVWGTGPNNVWVAMGSRTFNTHGETDELGNLSWTEFDSQSSYELTAFAGTSANDVWVVGATGRIRHFTEGAELWALVDSPTTNNLRAVWSASADDAWAVGEKGTILHFDGQGWKESTVAFPLEEPPDLYGVWGSGPDDVWAVGEGIILHYHGPNTGVGR